MPDRLAIRQELIEATPRLQSLNALVGLDGFVDRIMEVVDRRSGPGAAYTPVETIAALGARISAAAGRSANIELYPRLEKLGGNGPIMANALLSLGLATRYLGALGEANLHPVFEDFAQRTGAVSVADPGITQALEFTDGKIMLGTMSSLHGLTFDSIVAKIGTAGLAGLFHAADIVAMVNWTMLPHKTDILSRCLQEILPTLPHRESARTFFFDLADPQKRSDEDIAGVLEVITGYGQAGRAVLGLNLSEGLCVDRVLGFAPIGETPDALREIAARIRERLDLAAVVIHPVHGAAAATAAETAWVDGPVCAKPFITTGAGDHFNAGFISAYAGGLSLSACLTNGVCTSGQYVRTGQSPSLADTAAFLAQWVD